MSLDKPRGAWTNRSNSGTAWPVGQAGRKINIEDSWRVLDVGSGHHPHPRADVLLELHVDSHAERSGVAAVRDQRLIVGDAQTMPFADNEFDYVIASHVAEHVEDPERLCRELSRVASAGYIETPGWLTDILLRESFHRWRVRRDGPGLRFDRVRDPRPLGVLGDLAYAITYIGVERPGHAVPIPRTRLGRMLAYGTRVAIGRMMLLPGIRRFFYMEFEWRDEIRVLVR